MLNKLLTFIRCYHMLQPGDRVVCAVSGGADSMALLFAMYLLSDKLSVCVEAAHFNHHLRGEESDRDEAFVKSFCEGYGIPFYSGSGTVTPGVKGLEAAARDARYAFLKSLPGKIATAHTANDNAETVLMHMVRGTGLKGLGGITPVTDKLIRPMLRITRQEVLAFLAEYGVAYVDDSSNQTDRFLRNRIRHHVVPLLEQENPRLAENLSAMALRLREDEAVLEELTDCADADIAALREMPPARRSRVLAAFLEEKGVREPEAEHVALLESLVFSDKPSARANFPGGVAITRNYGKLEACCEAVQLPARVLACPGETHIAELGLTVICRTSNRCVDTPHTFTVVPVGTIKLRSREPGDTIRLPGGTKTLKKLFIDRKIPASQRLALPVVADDRGVLGVYGIGANRDRLAADVPGVEIQFKEVNSSGTL